MAQHLIHDSTLAPQLQLQQFIRFRWGLILLALLAALVGWFFHYPVSSWPLLSLLILTQSCSNSLLILLAKHTPRLPLLYASSCALDVLLISCMLLLSGGFSNGLVSVLLLPVAIGALLLPGRICYVLALLAIAAYSMLLLLGDLSHAEPITVLAADPHASHSLAYASFFQAPAKHGSHFNQHVLQMWWAFSLSVLILTGFISKQASLVRLKSRQLQHLQQQQLRQEQTLALATFAANTAHDLASPLQTISLLCDELAQPPAQVPAEIISELNAALQRCQHSVQQLRQDASGLRQLAPQPVRALVEQQLSRWLSSRPDMTLTLSHQLDGSDFLLHNSHNLSAALLNILDNAADASILNADPRLEVQLALTSQGLCLSIRDFGEGLSAARLAELGQIPQQSAEGLGIGQFLANMSIEQLGGQVQRENQTPGTLTRILLPRTEPH